MNLSAVASLLFVFSAPGPNLISAEPGSPHLPISDVLKFDFRYSSNALQKQSVEDALTAEGEIEILPPLEVYGSPRGLAKAILDYRKTKQSEVLSLKDGGNLFKNAGKRVTTELKFKVNLDDHCFHILSFSW